MTIPIESIFVTSSYVNVPPTDTLPLTLREESVPTDVIFGCAAAVSYTHLTLPTMRTV